MSNKKSSEKVLVHIMISLLLPIILIFFDQSYIIDAFTLSRSTCGSNVLVTLQLKKQQRLSPQKAMLSAKKVPDDTVPDVVTKASWYAVEAFGNIFKRSIKEEEISISTDQLPKSIQETYERIRIDNERYYFLSGTIDTLIYSEDCTFADPFVSFTGRDRFVTNLSNLGSFITKYNVKQLDYTPTENTVTTKFMVKLQLNLPWQPVLAWPWGVRCEIDPETFLIVLHQESWDIEPWEGVKQIFRKATTTV